MMKNDSFDAIVIGAGPAGASAASILAENGRLPPEQQGELARAGWPFPTVKASDLLLGFPGGFGITDKDWFMKAVENYCFRLA